MKSLTITLTRPGDAEGYPLRNNLEYVAICDTNPQKTIKIDCKQNDYYDKVKGLRYRDASSADAKVSIAFFEKLIKNVFADMQFFTIDISNPESLHIRIVADAMELAQLPFEFAPSTWDNTITATNTSLLANPSKVVSLTREVLQSAEAKYPWPAKPRILFIWAQPSNNPVPHKEHKDELLNALEPLLRPRKEIPQPTIDETLFFTEIPSASLKLISEAILKANKEKKPYSHIHILAHGSYVQDFSGVNCRIRLCDDTDPESMVNVNGDELQKAIIPDKQANIPTVVTLCSCDGGNAGNVIEPTGSLVYQLHRAGIPCVFASQFPLTQTGSVVLVRFLYADLISACDPRRVLYDVRMKLKETGNHDWASLVAYARFPANINEQLQAIRLKMLFASMEITGAWIDHVLLYKDQIIESEKIFKKIEDRLEHSIKDLSGYLNEKNLSTLETDKLKAEHLGLLGSAYKRHAEFYFRLSEFNPGNQRLNIESVQKALNTSKDFYYRGYKANFKNHWTAMQYLTLKAVMGESLNSNDNEHLTTIRFAARDNEDQAKERIEELIKETPDEKNQKEIEDTNMEIFWAWGTLAEAFLLTPLTAGKDSYGEELNSCREKAMNYSRMIRESNNDEIIDSTARQLDRYIFWWPKMYPDCFPKDLEETAVILKNIIRP